MKFRTLLFCFIIAVVSFAIGYARPVTFTSTATITLTLGTSTVDQATADAQKAAFLLDYCKARGLDQASPGNSVIADVKAIAKGVVVDYRAGQAAATQRVTDTAGIQP